MAAHQGGTIPYRLRRNIIIKSKLVAILIVALAGLGLGWLLWRPATRSLQFQPPAAKAEASSDFLKHYAAALRHVNDQGLVNYRGLKADRADLDAFAAAIGQVESTTFDAWSQAEQIAFLINAYNALTLEAIVSHYPIQSSLTGSLTAPRNSIRQIPGVWDRLKFRVLRQEMTLDHIEHQILRKRYDEPRIHVALVCAALGCPSLRNEPYTGDALDRQLDDQTRRFLAHADKFRIDREKGKVYLSSIFDWYGKDFVGRYGTGDRFQGHGGKEQALLNYISGYLSESDRQYLATGRYDVDFLDYDWSLNEQR